MFNRFFRRRRISKLDVPHVWGLWIPVKYHLAYKLLARHLQVPISVLAGHILREWITENYEELSLDEQKGNEFADYLVRTYLKMES